MSLNRIIAWLSFALVAMTCAVGYAQVTEVVVRQNDIIEWQGVSGPAHVVQFGGTVSGVTLTTPKQAQEIFTFDPQTPLLPNGLSKESGSNGKLLLKATVKAATPVNTTFRFACGNHPSQMLSIPFRVEAAGASPQTHIIKGVSGLHWKLEKSPTEDIHVDTTP